MSRPLDEAARDLAARHLPLADALARRLAARHGAPADDLRSAAHLGLCHAARDYDPALGASFPAFARWRVRRAIADERRRFARRARLFPRGGDVALLAADDGPAGDGWEGLVRGLPPAWRETIRLLYADPEVGDGPGRQNRAAAALGLSRHGVWLRHRAALALLRERLGVTP